MPTQLLTLPLRLGLRVAGIILRPLADVVEHALGADGHEQPAPDPRPERPSAPAPARPEPVAPRPPRRRATSRADVPAEPVHVSEEPVVVAEVADPGAEDGAGAQVTVAEPWEGYRQMKASDVIDRLAAATPEEIAVVQLYESMNRRRKTVLEAAGYSQRK
jgi:hypothetical protein